MTDQSPYRLAADELMALKFAARRQLTRWANAPDLQARQHAQRRALARAVRTLEQSTPGVAARLWPLATGGPRFSPPPQLLMRAPVASQACL
jgi:hypothetical protein